MGDDNVRDKVEFQFDNSDAEVQVTSLSERSRLTHIEGDPADLIDDVIVSAVSTTHFDNGTTFFALNIGTATETVTFHWSCDGYYPYDVEVLGC